MITAAPDRLVALSGVGVAVEGRPELLREIDLTVAPGDRIAIMGPSGSGKSTLLAVLGGLLTPHVGSVERPRVWVPSDVAWVFQQTYVLGHRSVRDNVALAGIAVGVPWPLARRAADVALDRVGLSDRRDVPAGRISGGERQRVGVARVLAAPRPIVLADEPTASLDAELVHSVTQLLVEESDPSIAVIIATHDQRVADMCTRVVHLDGGTIIEERHRARA